ncbi:MAG: response regulator [Deltaproteobacteria bacterium]|nr:response regulator [Deltaproteobacteria bacterium]
METHRQGGSSPDNPHRMEPETIRVMLVDDEEAYVNVLANRLQKRGFKVTKSYSGTEALQKLRYHKFDVIVLDLKMADMDGIEALKTIKIIGPRIQVIMLTGHGSATACEQGLKFGAFDYLMKPCELDDLVKKIKLAFRYKQQLEGQ